MLQMSDGCRAVTTCLDLHQQSHVCVCICVCVGACVASCECENRQMLPDSNTHPIDPEIRLKFRMLTQVMFFYVVFFSLHHFILVPKNTISQSLNLHKVNYNFDNRLIVKVKQGYEILLSLSGNLHIVFDIMGHFFNNALFFLPIPNHNCL